MPPSLSLFIFLIILVALVQQFYKVQPILSCILGLFSFVNIILEVQIGMQKTTSPPLDDFFIFFFI